MNNNVIVFSTRKLKEEGIFRDFIREVTVNGSLCNYFYRANKAALDVLKKAQPVVETGTVTLTQADFSGKIEALKQGLISHNLWNSDRADSIKNEEYKALFLGLRREKLTEELLKIINDLERMMPSVSGMESNEFSIKDFQVIELLNAKWSDNIEGDDKTLADRVSFFKYSGQQSSVTLYAVYPLTESASNGQSYEDNPWVKALVEGVKSKDVGQIILWLHDNDLSETRKKPFRVLFKDKIISEKKVSLGIFQHPDPEFNSILFPPEEETDKAKYVFDRVQSLFGAFAKMEKCDREGIIQKAYERLTPSQSQNNVDNG